MAEVERREEISASNVRMFLCDSDEYDVDKGNRKCVNTGIETESDNELREVFQIVKTCVETSRDYADWRW